MSKILNKQVPHVVYNAIKAYKAKLSKIMDPKIKEATEVTNGEY